MEMVRDAKVWTVEVEILESSDETEAKALLRSGDLEIGGWGRARRNPEDPDRPRVGDELAVARALADVAHGLLDAAATEVEEFEGRRVHLHG